MTLFSDDLLVHFQQWNNINFITDQLHKHLSEVEMLMKSDDTHKYAEMVDLMVILETYLLNNMNNDQINELIEYRKKKFFDKGLVQFNKGKQ